MKIAREKAAQPCAFSRDAQRARRSECKRDWQDQNPADLAGRQVEQRRQQKRQRERDGMPFPRDDPFADAPEPDRERRNERHEERGAEVVAKLRVVLNRDDADGDRFHGREHAEPEREREEDASGK